MNADLQARINDLIRYNQLQAVRDENRKYGTGTKGWWNTVNKITGRESKALNISSVINPVDINLFFQRINTDTQYIVPRSYYLFRNELASPVLTCLQLEGL